MIKFNTQEIVLERIRQHLPKTELAKRAKVSKQTVCNLENGLELKPETISKIITGLGKQIEDFIVK